LNLDISDYADPPLLVDELHIVVSRNNIFERQSLIRVDGAIGIVLALIGPPIRGSGRCKVDSLMVKPVRFQNLKRSAAVAAEFTASTPRGTDPRFRTDWQTEPH
jgi:hypothetical protein